MTDLQKLAILCKETAPRRRAEEARRPAPVYGEDYATGREWCHLGGVAIEGLRYVEVLNRRGQPQEVRRTKSGHQRLQYELWLILRDTILQRDNYTCQYCGANGPGVRLECDHVMPHSRGGSDDPSNLVTACRDCNRKKRTRTPSEWRQLQRTLAEAGLA